MSTCCRHEPLRVQAETDVGGSDLELRPSWLGLGLDPGAVVTLFSATD